LKKDN